MSKYIISLLVFILLVFNIISIIYILLNSQNTIKEKVVYPYSCNQLKINGFWTNDINRDKELIGNYTGRFICVNIDKVKTLNQLYNTCSHEVGHEIFAQICEKNITKCEELQP